MGDIWDFYEVQSFRGSSPMAQLQIAQWESPLDEISAELSRKTLYRADRPFNEHFIGSDLSALSHIWICAASAWISGSAIRTFARLNRVAQELNIDNTCPIVSCPDMTGPTLSTSSPASRRSSTSLLNQAVFYQAFDVNLDPTMEGFSPSHCSPVPYDHEPASTVCQVSGLDPPSNDHTIGMSVSPALRAGFQAHADEGAYDWLPSTWPPTLPHNLNLFLEDWCIEPFMLQN
ncbi:hypothetical protein AUEXF2481DRAFT_704689 [Aureobasidium subglaciale EXF-2481]|uniref:Uncharacterized protein n=1 Tax=Aureobasidium subglaciale (strain EXF-2481) TaxID=1043005 RepID=A0A074Y7Q9_AURSE|nr:uncharacterized protein AUEXF2481DRAFT_704689 [Aureobasidium subglaciale EXF-2481]KAI5194250.1 hypothetical protein E4T38_09636 [Aureobasidium subglaciale]KAI5213652.1 hypothetical protein E4T40_09578 [Aureobasidium subglaciale]KAI5215373.1 hypothetical protein E4T41_09616 [Aureobasidium subglaciale]KAI5253308.1 hypothetical protein E4T46_09593 [Aureobasidium subglaciale]KEQ90247.1 hypothetical protein AUEXF2481DRAFT_704689 [Aureobasidium subglaciale EXF-2481]